MSSKIDLDTDSVQTEEEALARDYAKKRVLYVEVQSGNDAVSSVLQKLTSRGFKIISFGIVKTKDTKIDCITIMLEPCNAHQFLQAKKQIESLVQVIRATIERIENVRQHVRVILSVTPKTRNEVVTLVGSLGGSIERSVGDKHLVAFCTSTVDVVDKFMAQLNVNIVRQWLYPPAANTELPLVDLSSGELIGVGS